MPLDLGPGARRGPVSGGFVAVVIAALLLAMTAHAGGAQVPPACPEPEPDGSDTPIMVSVGEQFVVALVANVTTGYRWQLDDPGADGVVALVGSEYVAPGAQLPGAGGKECWTFGATAEGATTLGLSYRRPFEPPSIPPVRTKQITVTASP
jgi:inhibitor of cysteine peptidase